MGRGFVFSHGLMCLCKEERVRDHFSGVHWCRPLSTVGSSRSLYPPNRSSCSYPSKTPNGHPMRDNESVCRQIPSGDSPRSVSLPLDTVMTLEEGTKPSPFHVPIVYCKPSRPL